MTEKTISNAEDPMAAWLKAAVPVRTTGYLNNIKSFSAGRYTPKKDVSKDVIIKRIKF